MTPSRPAGRRWTWLALAVAAVIVYGSFVPLRWREMSGRPTFSAQVRALPFAPFANLGSSDFFTNLFVALPLGFAGAAALADHSRRRLYGVLICSVLCAALAMAIELGQLFVRDRTAAWSDVFALTAGSIAGALTWGLAGPRILAWVRQVVHGDTLEARFRHVLVAYTLFWWATTLLPLLFPRFPYPLVRSVWLRPYVDLPFSVLLGAQLLAFMTLVPVGIVAGLAVRQHRMRGAVLLAACVAAVLLFERIQQVPLVPTPSEVGSRLLGLLSGVWLASAGPFSRLIQFLESPKRRTLILALVVWVCLLGLLYWAPFDFGIDAEARAFRIELLYSRVPFYRYYWSPPLFALRDILTVVLLAAPMAGMIRLALPASGQLADAGCVIAATCIFAGLEAGQLYLPARRADVTDVLIAGTGAIIGVVLTRVVAGSGLPPRGDS